VAVVELAQGVQAIWESLLGVRGLDPADSFFELGGTSILAAKLVILVEEQLGVQIQLSDVFEHSTLGEFIALVEQSSVPGRT
jgi:acyl carrier protein